MVRGQLVAGGGILFQKAQFGSTEQPLGGVFRHRPTQQGHHHDPPGNHHLNRDRPPQPLCRSKRQVLGLATGLQGSEEILHPPTAQIIPDQLRGCPHGLHRHTGQQEPLDGRFPCGGPTSTTWVTYTVTGAAVGSDGASNST